MGLFGGGNSSATQYDTQLTDQGYDQTAADNESQIFNPNVLSSGSNARSIESGLFSVGDDLGGDVNVVQTDLDAVEKAFTFARVNAENLNQTMGDVLDWSNKTLDNNSDDLKTYKDGLFSMSEKAIGSVSSAYNTAEQLTEPINPFYYVGLLVAGFILYKKVKK